jgi:hypothetical protein
MVKKVQELRRTILPWQIFEMIESYMNGEAEAINILLLHKTKGVLQFTAGAAPEKVSANDTVFD